MLDLTRGLVQLRARHPALADGDISAILCDSAEWMVFEKAAGPQRYLVLINLTATDRDYKLPKDYLHYARAQQVFSSDGKRRKWEDLTGADHRIADIVAVPAFGMAVLHGSGSRGKEGVGMGWRSKPARGK
jgi:hypothetical protein